MQRVREEITNLAALPWHVRIEGPSGSGKTLAARLLHRLWLVARGPFVLCSLAMLPDGMELAELVGHRRGSYTGAVEDRAGIAEQAHGGILYTQRLKSTSRRRTLDLQPPRGSHSFRRRSQPYFPQPLICSEASMSHSQSEKDPAGLAP